jgi:hypothetical protein
MYNLLVKLMFIAAIAELGISLSKIENCNSRLCIAEFEQRSRQILTINWKTISVFPKEAKRFH